MRLLSLHPQLFTPLHGYYKYLKLDFTGFKATQVFKALEKLWLYVQ